MRVERNATLASSGLRTYMRGLIRDLTAAYPECDGFRFDWPEYPRYHFLSLLTDYNPQVAPVAQKMGIDFSKLAAELSETCPEDMVRKAIIDDVAPSAALAQLRQSNSAWDDHFRLRERLVKDFLSFLRQEVGDASDSTKRMFIQGFPPPWDEMSGFAAGAINGPADDVASSFTRCIGR